MKLKRDTIIYAIKVVGIIVLMLVQMIVYQHILESKENSKNEIKYKTAELFKSIENINCTFLEKYTIYGNHLNLGGYMLLNDLENQNINNVNLVVMNLDKEEKEYDLKYNIKDNRIDFTLSEKINEGIDLEKIDIGYYYIFLKVDILSNEKNVTKYYSVKNNTNYTENEYYTLTKNHNNYKIDICFSEYVQDKNTINYMNLSVIETVLPDEVYDIVIDPGHGGTDPGTSYNGENESKHTLTFAFGIKEKLEELGYKVKLTRQKDEYVDSYGENGRAIIPYKTKAKLFLSIHLNSTVGTNEHGGVEIYAPNESNIEFAKLFADNIVTNVSVNYSANGQFKVGEGVYVKTYTKQDVEDAIKYAQDIGYEPYENLSTKTPYYFMIRETGGIMTYAYVDGRNKQIGDNIYHDSNIAAESYLLELGFLNSKNDFNKLINNKQEYINAIVQSIVTHYIK